MSKIEKLLLKLCRKPAPTDFTWDDLITLTRRAGFKESCTGGSHYMFQHESGYLFRASKTHPSGLLKAYQIRSAIEALKTAGFIPEGSDNED